MGEDEANCEVVDCQSPDRVRCANNKRCIDKSFVCDGRDNCGDNSDESHCGVPMNCTTREFKCANNFCIPPTWRCDGENDCGDNTDELNCTTMPCLESQFACGDLTCIPADDHCNHVQDCPDNSDEIGCDADVVVCDPATEFTCKYPVCVLEEYRCDGDNDCGDWSDEANCLPRPGDLCPRGDFQCRKGNCIPARLRCNGAQECEEGEDELDCTPTPATTCAPTEYACSNGYCIQSSWVCDAIEDCPSGEDESVCDQGCNNQTHFTCSPEEQRPSPPSLSSPLVVPKTFFVGGLSAAPALVCIPKKHVCDGTEDCSAGDDERDCPRVANCSAGAGCQHKCLETADGREVCGCRPGFRLQPDGRACADVDECADDQDPPCDHDCTNTEGSFSCSCKPGYVLRPDQRTCKSVDTPATLLVTNRVDIRQVNLNNHRSRVILRGLHNAVALDFHWRAGEVFWSDYSMHVIKKATLNGSQEQDVVRWGLQNPAGLAVDWVHNLLFWSDSELCRVDVANLDGSMPTTIAHTDLDKPRDVTVHPEKAFVFWTDWGPTPKIERVEMNGQNRKAIITKEVRWPNGLALDYDAGRVFWVDAMYHRIESADLDGNGRTTVLSKGLPHPFALTLFEDNVYWTDWHTHSVMGANKATGQRAHPVLENLHFPMQIHSCHPNRQQAYRDRCPRGVDACSHLCLPSAASFTCICPVGVKLQANRRLCESTPEKLLVYVRKKEIRLREMAGTVGSEDERYLGLGSSARDVVLPVDGVRHAQAVAWDAKEDSIFWSDFKSATISRSRRDGSDQRVVVGTDLEEALGLAVDWVRRRLYFSDFKSKRIETTDLEGGERVVLLHALSGPRHLVLYPPAGLMFWSSWGSKPLIEAAGMDGKGRKPFISDRLLAPAALAIDPEFKRLYWTDSKLGEVNRINVDGTGERLVVVDHLPHPLGVAVYDNRLYWTDGATHTIHVQKEDGKKNYTVRSDVSGLMGVAVMHQRRQSVRTACDKDNYGCSHVCLLANNRDRAGCACPVGYRMKSGDSKACEQHPGPYLLLARTHDVRKVPMGMPYLMDTLLTSTELQNTVAVDVDRATGDVYWSDTILSAIMKTSKEGNDPTVVVGSGLDTPYGLAVDSVGKKLYWTDSGRRIIEVSELDGSRRKVLIWDDLRSPCALTLLYAKGLMFWSDWDEHKGRIERAAMDGSGRTAIVTDNVAWPGGLAVHEGRLYWSDVYTCTVESARLDGSDRTHIIVRLRERPAGIAIMDRYVYWGYRGPTGALHRVALPRGPQPVNATEDSIIRPGLPFLMDVKAVEPGPLPPDECANASCSDLCLRVPGGHVCACPTGVVMSDHVTCSGNVTEMLVFATPDGLARIATNALQRFHDVLLPVPDVRKVVAVDFHWEHKAIVFADMSRRMIRSVSMKDWSRTTTVIGNLSEPTGVAVDWLADNVFWTDAGRLTVEVARLDGSSRKVLIREALQSPRGIVLHPKNGLMFWTDWGKNGEAAGTKIESAHLDGSGRRAIVSTDLDKPNGLALDHKGGRLYWANYGRARIESCEITGNDRIQIVEQAVNVFGLTTLGEHIYWTDFGKRTLERAAKNSGRDRMTVDIMMDQVEDLKAVASSRQRRIGVPPCGADNGGCSHLCLAREVDVVCACPDQPAGPCSHAPEPAAPHPPPSPSQPVPACPSAPESDPVLNAAAPCVSALGLSQALLSGVPVLMLLVVVAAGAAAGGGERHDRRLRGRGPAGGGGRRGGVPVPAATPRPLVR
ncbi:hypothetical protein ONE63_005730 [Megalurothrips usitatus]|uniref:EGF-like domain-containing protein n=1 Tax=Megalurothrips usitatus TaxID=439358 RepID=A0AAV7XWI2_9NEOP|nr:hypothetical protein ONE63_005730 [Megalurothrips usitatus]